jgi:hypothetical protein
MGFQRADGADDLGGQVLKGFGSVRDGELDPKWLTKEDRGTLRKDLGVHWTIGFCADADHYRDFNRHSSSLNFLHFFCPVSVSSHRQTTIKTLRDITALDVQWFQFSVARRDMVWLGHVMLSAYLIVVQLCGANSTDIIASPASGI